MVPVHLRPLMPLFVMPPTLRTMTPLLHILIPLPLCNSRTLPLGLGTSDAQLQSPPPLLPLMFNAGCSLAPSDCTHRLSINFLEPPLLISLHSLKIISLATSVWTNSSRYFPLIPLIPRLCTPRSSNLGHPSALKSRLLRSHVNPLQLVLLPLPFPLTPCPHMPPNHLPPALTLQLSRSLLPFLPIPPLLTLLLLPFPLSLLLK